MLLHPSHGSNGRAVPDEAVVELRELVAANGFEPRVRALMQKASTAR